MLRKIEDRFFLFLSNTGEMALLAGKATAMAFQKPYYQRLIVSRMFLDGIKSLPVIFLTSIFTGGVLTLQSYFGMSRIGAESFTGALVGVSLTKELIPVLTGLMLSGRVCASYCAEIGTMVVTEQVDALFTFGVNPIKYLATPRLVAMAVMTPMLTLFGDFIAICGGKIVASAVCRQNPNLFDSQIFTWLQLWDIEYGLIKAFFFGIVIAVVGCFFGLKTVGGAKGVGRATTSAVVAASIIVLVSDFFWSKLLPFSLR